MKIEHLAIWTTDLEKMRAFYTTFFNGTSNAKYTNSLKGFESYFITFASGARLELMYSSKVQKRTDNLENLGYAHLAFSAGSKEKVDELTNTIKQSGFEVIAGPRVTGDGYYESTILDPEKNMVEITI